MLIESAVVGVVLMMPQQSCIPTTDNHQGDWLHRETVDFSRGWVDAHGVTDQRMTAGGETIAEATAKIWNGGYVDGQHVRGMGDDWITYRYHYARYSDSIPRNIAYGHLDSTPFGLGIYGINGLYQSEFALSAIDLPDLDQLIDGDVDEHPDLFRWPFDSFMTIGVAHHVPGRLPSYSTLGDDDSGFDDMCDGTFSGPNLAIVRNNLDERDFTPWDGTLGANVHTLIFQFTMRRGSPVIASFGEIQSWSSASDFFRTNLFYPLAGHCTFGAYDGLLRYDLNHFTTGSACLDEVGDDGMLVTGFTDNGSASMHIEFLCTPSRRVFLYGFWQNIQYPRPGEPWDLGFTVDFEPIDLTNAPIGAIFATANGYDRCEQSFEDGMNLQLRCMDDHIEVRPMYTPYDTVRYTIRQDGVDVTSIETAGTKVLRVNGVGGAPVLVDRLATIDDFIGLHTVNDLMIELPDGSLVTGDAIRISPIDDADTTNARMFDRLEMRTAMIPSFVIRNESFGLPCRFDIEPAVGNGAVDVDDLLAIINDFGPCEQCATDLAPVEGNDEVNIDDLIEAIINFGPCD